MGGKPGVNVVMKNLSLVGVSFFSIYLAVILAETAFRSGRQTTAGPARAAALQLEVCRLHCSNMRILASDALRGRGSGAPTRLVAAACAREHGIAPAGDRREISRATLQQPKFTGSRN